MEKEGNWNRTKEIKQKKGKPKAKKRGKQGT
jgi:hypothetical protein